MGHVTAKILIYQREQICEKISAGSEYVEAG
jgi:hypothetical protein